MSALDLEAIYRAHGSALLAYLRRAFGRWCAPEDLLQETFLQAVRRPDRVAMAESPRAWLFGIARHVGLAAMRKHRTVEELRDVAENREETDGDLEAMRLAIAELGNEMREALELRLREELSYEEIARVLGIPIGTVRSRLHGTMRKLREKLAERES